MKKRYHAIIEFNTDAQHPDSQNAKNLSYTDTYTIDSDAFYGPEDIRDYITEDLRLVAGGGYDSKHINNVTIKITEV